MRTANIERNTKETRIRLSLNLDGSGKCDIKSGCGFLDHMLTLFASHGRMDLELFCEGDTYVDYHHTTEDISIVLGEAILKALGDKRGINRYGYMILPMDEALVICALDFSGRCQLGYDVQIPTQKVGDFDTELAEEFWLGFSRNAACNLHFKQLSGTNSHHILEACFKACGRAVRMAVSEDPSLNGEIPSTKGML